MKKAIKVVAVVILLLIILFLFLSLEVLNDNQQILVKQNNAQQEQIENLNKDIDDLYEVDKAIIQGIKKNKEEQPVEPEFKKVSYYPAVFATSLELLKAITKKAVVAF